MAKVGKNNIGVEKHYVDRIMDVKTIFSHKECHKITYFTNGLTENQEDPCISANKP